MKSKQFALVNEEILVEITTELCQKLKNNYEGTPRYKLAELGVVRNGVVESAENVLSKRENPFEFSIEVPTLKIPQQNQSGRCWLFAIINILNQQISQKLGIKEFYLSQNYLYFYDKLEKANFFYKNIIETADLELDSRELNFLLSKPQEDGGQWDMLVSLIEKYGLVPSYAMPETENSRSSADMNKYINAKLRLDAKKLRQLVADHCSQKEIDEIITKMLAEVYQMLAICIGVPPEKVDVKYRDAAGNYQAELNITPKEFANKYLMVDLKDYIPIINAPSKNKNYNQTYTVAMMGNIVEGQSIKYLNVDMSTLKRLTINQLKGNEAVWFGCDIGQYTDRKLGIMAPDIYAVDILFDVDFSSNKQDRLEYCQSLLTHAMVISGVDLENDQPTIWKVQNSWGEEIGYKGFFMMTDDWMSEYVYQVVINKKYLTEEQLTRYQEEPIVLSPWDPMGSLAK
ncbi:C1 family peptidase [Enterococcus sp. MJM12]|uniref:Aminopeptidase n=1 Tax=Candidatus Enterococcus myersii TaxID=2815322 RepID=A0ABS3H4M2_9ENTE|nr:C1 family peptidase [Enterococcus sp. MJM12]MBO0448400.1 C1 family peptidase [Enterococcus sp. MJM12]